MYTSATALTGWLDGWYSHLANSTTVDLFLTMSSRWWERASLVVDLVSTTAVDGGVGVENPFIFQRPPQRVLGRSRG